MKLLKRLSMKVPLKSFETLSSVEMDDITVSLYSWPGYMYDEIVPYHSPCWHTTLYP